MPTVPAAVPARPSPAGDLRVDRHVAVPMRDGTILRADVYRSADGVPAPVLVMRTPYDRTAPIAAGTIPDALRATAAGYALVIQDTRGRYGSDGAFVPFEHEQADGYDTVEWAAAQPWSTGAVGMIGGSYVGYTQWMAAAAEPPHLRAIAPLLTAADLHDGWVSEGGVRAQWFNVTWLLASLAPDVLARIAPGDLARRDRLRAAIDHLEAHVPALPGAVDEAIEAAGLGDVYRTWLAHPERDAYWQALSPREAHARIRVPAFVVAGWWDIFVGGSLQGFMGLRADGATPAARDGTQLVVGPWRHGQPSFDDPVGERRFGVASSGGGIDMPGLQLAFFDRWLKGDAGAPTATAGPDTAPVRLFVVGDGWRDETAWPPPDAVATPWHLRADGSLTIAPPLEGEGSTTFLADPADPVPTVGGNLCCGNLALVPGSFDQRAVEARDDVLVWSTPPLGEPLEVIGGVTVSVFVRSTAPDFDIAAKLVDVDPDGRAWNVAEGIRRARYRAGTAAAAPLEPGTLAELEVDLHGTAIVFAAGHRVRLEIAASSWPRFERNPQTGGSVAEATELRAAHHTVVHEATHPSAIRLPVMHREVR